MPRLKSWVRLPSSAPIFSRSVYAGLLAFQAGWCEFKSRPWDQVCRDGSKLTSRAVRTVLSFSIKSDPGARIRQVRLIGLGRCPLKAKMPVQFRYLLPRTPWANRCKVSRLAARLSPTTLLRERTPGSNSPSNSYEEIVHVEDVRFATGRGARLTGQQKVC